MKIFLSIIIAITLSACSSVTIKTDKGSELRVAPSFQQSYTYWWWGLRGEHTINAREICIGRPVEQMQSTYTITDTLAGLFTLGIYAPRSARVWCGETE